MASNRRSQSFLAKILNALKIVPMAIFSYFYVLVKGSIATKTSYVIMGMGNILRGQIIRGLLFLAVQVGYILYMINFGWGYLSKFLTLGTKETGQVFDEELGIEYFQFGDNSMKILLFSVISIGITVAALWAYFGNIKNSYDNDKLRKQGKKLPTFKQDFKSLFNENYHITLLAFPTIMVVSFTVLPIIFMICMAFTNFDKSHQPPGNLFTWVGLDNFSNLFSRHPQMPGTLQGILIWTFIWAIAATATNYIFGMILAMIINKKGIKAKKMWRTIFVITIAVPQFVSLMIMSKMLADQGPVNAILLDLGLITEPIRFFGTTLMARLSVITVNMWVGIPHTMLITTGILMNIPEDMYESARIDGAGPVKSFTKITLPYMFFVTTPYLITQFVGNLNNFNVIFLLTGGGPLNDTSYYQAGKTDLLVTWLYKLTVNNNDYNLASAIGIVVFIISATFALISYNVSASSKEEGQFQ